MGVQMCLWHVDFFSFGYLLSRKVASLNFLWNFHTIFMVPVFNLYSHQQCTRIPFFLVVLEFELRALHLLGRHSNTWALFCFSYFSDRVLHFCLGWTTVLLPMPPMYLGPQARTIMSSLLVEMGTSLTFYLVLALNHNPPDLCLSSSWDYRHEQLSPA
jgi:hypothetical protein